jgi:hypothetical protein
MVFWLPMAIQRRGAVAVKRRILPYYLLLAAVRMKGTASDEIMKRWSTRMLVMFRKQKQSLHHRRTPYPL